MTLKQFPFIILAILIITACDKTEIEPFYLGEFSGPLVLYRNNPGGSWVDTLNQFFKLEISTNDKGIKIHSTAPYLNNTGFVIDTLKSEIENGIVKFREEPNEDSRYYILKVYELENGMDSVYLEAFLEPIGGVFNYHRFKGHK